VPTIRCDFQTPTSFTVEAGGESSLIQSHRSKRDSAESAQKTSLSLWPSEFDEKALNTLSRERAEDLVASTRYRQLRTSTVRVDRLDAVLGRHLGAGVDIDLLSVDTEGLDADVLESNDWTSFRPRIVIVEVLGMNSVCDLSSSTVSRILDAHGYSPVAVTGNSAIFRAGS
jgi:hypothetical protein